MEYFVALSQWDHGIDPGNLVSAEKQKEERLRAHQALEGLPPETWGLLPGHLTSQRLQPLSRDHVFNARLGGRFSNHTLAIFDTFPFEVSYPPVIGPLQLLGCFSWHQVCFPSWQRVYTVYFTHSTSPEGGTKSHVLLSHLTTAAL